MKIEKLLPEEWHGTLQRIKSPTRETHTAFGVNLQQFRSRILIHITENEPVRLGVAGLIGGIQTTIALHEVRISIAIQIGGSNRGPPSQE